MPAILPAKKGFSPPLWATVLFVVVGTSMLLLGRWQLQRAALKISMAEHAEQALGGDVQGIGSILQEHPALLADNDGASSAASPAPSAVWRVVADGELLGEQLFLWDNRIHKGRAGFEVVVPLLLKEPAAVLLVNRGWVEVGRSRTEVPDIRMPPADAIPGQQMRIEGLLTRPSKGFASGEVAGFNNVDEWPKLLPYLDYDSISGILGHPVIAGLVQNVSATTPAAEGFLKPDNWQPASSGPEKHYGYAFQWFAMFVALCIIYWVTNRRVTSKAQNSETSIGN